MAVYPFYTEVSSTTRSSSVGVGCRAKNGSMTTKIYQRENGEITTDEYIYWKLNYKNN